MEKITKRNNEKTFRDRGSGFVVIDQKKLIL